MFLYFTAVNTILAALFWFCLFLVFYTYAGYSILIAIIIRFRGFRKRMSMDTKTLFLPQVALIIPAFNEDKFIRKKIENSIALDYPGSHLRIVVITDGSTDKTDDTVKQFPKVVLLHQPERKGKSAAMNRAVEYCTDEEIIIFSDANTLLNPDAVKLLVRHFTDPSVGGVSGEKKVIMAGDDQGEGEGEAFYWKYESFLKKLDSRFYTITGAAGELFAMRRTLYQPIPESIILDDFYISMMICKKGFIVRYEPEAVAVESTSASIKDEEKRKIRIGAGAFQGMALMLPLMNPFRYGRLAFQYVSRRVIRWAVAGPALLLAFVLNGIIVFQDLAPENVYNFLLSGQIIFYTFAMAGWLMMRGKMGKITVFYYPFYFLFMNLSVWAGFLKFITGSQSAVWEKSERKDLNQNVSDRRNT